MPGQECRRAGTQGSWSRNESSQGRDESSQGRDAAAGTGMQSILVAWAGMQGSRNAGQQERRDESRQSRDAPRPLSLQPLTFLHRTQLGADEGNADEKSWQEPVQVPAAPGFQLI